MFSKKKTECRVCGYSRDHIVKELSGKRAVITYGGTVVAAVNVDDLTLV